MPLSIATVGGKITAAFMNLVIAQVNQQALTTIIPASVAGTGVTVGTYGKVSFSAATTVSVNGCFSATYDVYDIFIVATSTTANAPTARLRLAGTDSSAAVYDRQRLTGSSATASAAQSLAQTSWVLGAADLIARHKLRINLENVAVAGVTTGDFVATSINNPMTTSTGIAFSALQHQSATAYDGITISAPAGTITGYLLIRGYNSQA